MHRTLLVLAAFLLSCAHRPAGGGQRALTAEAFARAVSVSNAALSKDGKVRAWVSDCTGARELWLDDSRDDGGPRQLTTAGEKLRGVFFGNDGSVFFEQDYGGNERFDLFRVDPASYEVRRLTDSKEVSEEGAELSPDGAKLAYLSDPDQPFRFQIFVRELGDGQPRQLTRSSLIHAALRWSPDGRTLVATRTGDFQKGVLVVLEVETGEERVLPPPQPGGITWAAGFLPDGTLLALSLNPQGFMQLLHVDLASGQQRFVGPGDWDVEEAVVAQSGTIAFTRNVHAQSELLIASGLEGLATPRVLEEGGVIGSLAIDDAGKTLLAVGQSASQPSALVCHDLERNRRWVCVRPDAGGIELGRLPEARLRTFPSFDGTPIDALILTPPGLAAPAPAVVLVHGGPNGQTRPIFDPFDLAIADVGFVVIQPNYRGSTGYGRAFEDLNNKDWCGGDYKDLVAVVEALAKAGEIDPKRVAIGGGSYGGYMTLCAVGREPERWAAAVDMYGMPDLVVDYEMTRDRFGPWYETEMGTPATHPELFRDRSPITRIDQVRTPMLVLQGANDSNVPKAQSDRVVEALKARGVPVEYVVYPNEGHGFLRRENRLDAIDRAVRFLRERLR